MPSFRHINIFVGLVSRARTGRLLDLLCQPTLDMASHPGPNRCLAVLQFEHPGALGACTSFALSTAQAESHSTYQGLRHGEIGKTPKTELRMHRKSSCLPESRPQRASCSCVLSALPHRSVRTSNALPSSSKSQLATGSTASLTAKSP